MQHLFRDFSRRLLTDISRKRILDPKVETGVASEFCLTIRDRETVEIRRRLNNSPDMLIRQTKPWLTTGVVVAHRRPTCPRRRPTCPRRRPSHHRRRPPHRTAGHLAPVAGHLTIAAGRPALTAGRSAPAAGHFIIAAGHLTIAAGRSARSAPYSELVFNGPVSIQGTCV